MTTATEGLLAALRRHTDRPTLTWSSPPAPLAGGFWAEMYIIELATHQTNSTGGSSQGSCPTPTPPHSRPQCSATSPIAGSLCRPFAAPAGRAANSIVPGA